MSIGVAAVFSPTMKRLETAAVAGLGETELRRAVARGTGLDLDKAVAFARGADGVATAPPE
ncbi:hypothetical protein GCM10010495_52290 [Kitasatospora herbaricolor]|uniref:hypothetical protein n=1 Tax=Kitasatospora herbaricolor TaxID=68217 RepID=UPI00174947A1|nr:hypothetical protein [Kitasatospora herbaricolor]MDQ0312605.1 hypothetical protein [Kitasatospora herbaricolor]GGV29664.1 hypothetical protein GCM10010495_52290 [Kitasatospora herbaricolor]